MLTIIWNIFSSLVEFLSYPWGLRWSRSHRHPPQISPVVRVTLEVKTWVYGSFAFSEAPGWEVGCTGCVKCITSHIFFCFLISNVSAVWMNEVCKLMSFYVCRVLLTLSGQRLMGTPCLWTFFLETLCLSSAYKIFSTQESSLILS